VFRGGWITCTKQYVGRLPIRVPRSDSQSDKRLHDRIVTLVGRMLQAQERKRSTKLAQWQMDQVEREIAWTDEQIDELVYQVYGITKDERKIIQGE